MAKKCDELTQTKQLEEQYNSLQHHLFDSTTMPKYSVGPQTNKSLRSILPHFPYADKVYSLPICFEWIPYYSEYFSEDMRTFRYLLEPYFRDRDEDIFLTGNVPIPFSQLPEYYFEVTIGNSRIGYHLYLRFLYKCLTFLFCLVLTL